MASPAQATPGDSPGPGGGEPTIMAFRRPLDRPALAARPASAASGDVPVVLKLPDLARPAGAALADSEPASAKPWISMALWAVTGVLAVVAVAVLLVGKPTSEPAMEDAPSWQAPPIGAAAGSTQSNGGSQAPPLAQPGSAPAGGYPATQPQSGGQTWNDRGAIGQSLESQPASGYPAGEAQPGGGTVPGAVAPGGPAASGQYPGGGYPATGYPTAGYPSTATPGGALPGGTAPGGTVPGGGVQPLDNPNGPAAGGDSWSPDAPAPDQTKKLEVHNYQLSARPGAPTGTARLDGGIRNLETRPGDDSTR